MISGREFKSGSLVRVMRGDLRGGRDSTAKLVVNLGSDIRF